MWERWNVKISLQAWLTRWAFFQGLLVILVTIKFLTVDNPKHILRGCREYWFALQNGGRLRFPIS